jgi:mersacidin/lichenicidin family type 2 lantibiotic
MSQVNVIRAWKDEEYRNSLSAEERAALPENPAGLVELTEAELRANGAFGPGGFGGFGGFFGSFACHTFPGDGCSVTICVSCSTFLTCPGC